MDLNIFINNKLIHLTKKYAIIQACAFVSINLPRFCYHDRLSVAANCRMCLVQLEDSLKPIAACAVPVSNNMRIFTDTNLIKKAREAVLEFLLINHPLDCPICDQGGECDLQDQTIVFGSDRGRYFELKRAVKELNLGPVIKTFMTRCIHCTRCIRLSREVLNSVELGLIGRGNNERISTFINKSIGSYLSGNLADICPVGALTSKPFAFTARPWELKSCQSIDIFDCMGTNLRIDVRGSEIMRILPNIKPFSEIFWISDKTRLYFDGLYRQRTTKPFINKLDRSNIIVHLAWNQIFYILYIYLVNFLEYDLLSNKLNPAIYDYSAEFKLVHGPNIDANSMVELKRLQNVFGDYIFQMFGPSQFTFRFEYLCSVSPNVLKNLPIKVLVGLLPDEENPVLNSILFNASNFTLVISYIIGPKESSPELSGGFSTFSILNLIKGKSATARLLASFFPSKLAALPLLVGGSFMARMDYRFMKSFFDLLSTKDEYLFQPEFFLLNSSQLNKAELALPYPMV